MEAAHDVGLDVNDLLLTLANNVFDCKNDLVDIFDSVEEAQYTLQDITNKVTNGIVRCDQAIQDIQSALRFDPSHEEIVYPLVKEDIGRYRTLSPPSSPLGNRQHLPLLPPPRPLPPALPPPASPPSASPPPASPPSASPAPASPPPASPAPASPPPASSPPASPPPASPPPASPPPASPPPASPPLVSPLPASPPPASPPPASPPPASPPPASPPPASPPPASPPPASPPPASPPPASPPSSPFEVLSILAPSPVFSQSPPHTPLITPTQDRSAMLSKSPPQVNTPSEPPLKRSKRLLFPQSKPQPSINQV